MSNIPFPVLAAMSSADRVFAAILSLLGLCLAVLVSVALVRKKRRRAAEAAARRETAEPSLDERYARSSGRWVCRYCETINDEGLGLCQACGQPRN